MLHGREAGCDCPACQPDYQEGLGWEMALVGCAALMGVVVVAMLVVGYLLR